MAKGKMVIGLEPAKISPAQLIKRFMVHQHSLSPQSSRQANNQVILCPWVNKDIMVQEGGSNSVCAQTLFPNNEQLSLTVAAKKQPAKVVGDGQ